MTKLSCFKAYDIRGQLGEELNEDIAYRIGRAYAEFIKPKVVVVGNDVRLTSKSLKLALSSGLRDAGVNVLDIGLAGTEEIYFATFHLAIDGGIAVTASHNPINYNGMKLVGAGARPISSNTGLLDIERLVKLNKFSSINSINMGSYRQISILDAYIDHLMSYLNPAHLKTLKLVINSGNGAAGHVIDALENRFKQLKIPITLIKIHHQPDGTFPNGIPNPQLPECRQDTSNIVLAHGADIGIAFDSDFDRCFLFNHRGEFIEGYYIVGLLAEVFLKKEPGAKIVYDPRLNWNTIELVRAIGGQPIISKSGHAFIKQCMRKENAIYGGEMSAHHYFRDFSYCDSGMIPWLLVIELLCVKNKTLEQVIKHRIATYPISGEINFKLVNPTIAMEYIRTAYQQYALYSDEIDGINLEFTDWRFNLRSSNTEPVVRLNVESRANKTLLNKKTNEILELLRRIH
ncbi:phosphomannomutase CpsG [Candidatus Fukatsuia anoeciicola]|uniref:phosphomannomutase CpsG n=1 Tax=Candidatus Fukatsuia anoeciicola TaxID=2994492 RepID=UPI003464D2B1